MSTLQKIRNQITGARKKVAHAADVAEHAGKRVDHFREVKKQSPEGSAKRKRANRKLNYWTAVYKRALHAKAIWGAVLNRRIAKKHKYLKEHPPALDPDGDGLIVMDGRQIVEWIGKIALAARAASEWHGSLLSGFRTPEYSEYICIHQVCGHPSCPGTCAGRASRHSERGLHRGAGDFTNPWELEAYCRKHGLPLHGNGTVLPNDHNHFSYEGN